MGGGFRVFVVLFCSFVVFFVVVVFFMYFLFI